MEFGRRLGPSLLAAFNNIASSIFDDLVNNVLEGIPNIGLGTELSRLISKYTSLQNRRVEQRLESQENYDSSPATSVGFYQSYMFFTVIKHVQMR